MRKRGRGRNVLASELGLCELERTTCCTNKLSRPAMNTRQQAPSFLQPPCIMVFTPANRKITRNARETHPCAPPAPPILRFPSHGPDSYLTLNSLQRSHGVFHLQPSQILDGPCQLDNLRTYVPRKKSRREGKKNSKGTKYTMWVRGKKRKAPPKGSTEIPV